MMCHCERTAKQVAWQSRLTIQDEIAYSKEYNVVGLRIAFGVLRDPRNDT